MATQSIHEQSESQKSSPDKGESGERNILADLDKIINNLEAQKNMETFGFQDEEPKPVVKAQLSPGAI